MLQSDSLSLTWSYKDKPEEALRQVFQGNNTMKKVTHNERVY